MSEKISIVMPAYNAEKYIKAAIDSIVNQTYVNWELLIADDGSNDKTNEIIQHYVKSDHRIKSYPNEKNLGYLHTCNRLFKICQGTYVGFQDADDISHPSRIEKQVAFLQQQNHVILTGCRAAYFKHAPDQFIKIKNVPTDHEVISEKLFENNQFSGASVLFRRELFDSIGYYQEYFDRIGNEHYDYYFRAAQKHKVANLQEVLYYVRVLATSFSRDIKSPRQFISGDITRFLARQREEFGKDSLTGLDFLPLEKFERSLLIKFNKDKSLIHRTVADILTYNGLYKQSLGRSMKAFLAKPYKVINFKYLLAGIKNLIYQK
jgi:glycosyltransferase involved in cell wall biosynthesis